MGSFIVFEGLDGAGKSTQIRLLGNWLEAMGVPTDIVREPGGTPAGEAIRSIMFGPRAKPLHPLTWTFLMNAARAQLVEDCIRPSLAAGRIVLADRYWYSTLAYQAGGDGVSESVVRELSETATQRIEPELVIYLDLAPETVADRKRGQEPNVLDNRPLAFHQRVATAYRMMAESNPKQWRVFDATLPPDSLSEGIRNLVAAHLGQDSLRL